jgi:gamma-butyrobetaine dioxygenase
MPGDTGSMRETASVRAATGDLELAADGRTLRFPAGWLRDNCPCPLCLDPVTGQRLHDITDIPEDCAVATTSDEPEHIVVTFAPDGHSSRFSRAWLTGHALDGYGDSDPRADGKQLWRKADLDGRIPEGDWRAYLENPGYRADRLRDVMRKGFVMLRDVPVAAGTVLTVARTFGYVRETNYGALFDVRVEPAPENLAFTSSEITPHTDNPYRDPVPTVQLLHCLRSAGPGDVGAGGESGLVDGFMAAAILRDEDPEAFAVVTGTMCSFGYTDNGTELRACQPLIHLDPRGRVRGIRFNNRSALPLRAPYDEVLAFYAGYRRWAALLRRDELRVEFTLKPGDCLIFDNTRVLHARTAFTATEPRHLQGCYADLDGLESTVAVLSREPRSWTAR